MGHQCEMRWEDFGWRNDGRRKQTTNSTPIRNYLLRVRHASPPFFTENEFRVRNTMWGVSRKNRCPANTSHIEKIRFKEKTLPKNYKKIFRGDFAFVETKKIKLVTSSSEHAKRSAFPGFQYCTWISARVTVFPAWLVSWKMLIYCHRDWLFSRSPGAEKTSGIRPASPPGPFCCCW